MKVQRQYFGWYDSTQQDYLLSKLPPDAPVRKATAFKELAELKANLERRRGRVYWDPLPPGMTAADNHPTPIVVEKHDPDKARAAAADLQRRQQGARNVPSAGSGAASPGDDIWRGWLLP
jgi:hypothetical protein